ncbi:endonuclease NucS domain-containing protein [Chromobacterium sp. IIBBL 290-4]|uniref:endonuclease NucS domain-containing protein n=1 Tax=Chromobacterium sp. IIBBL 290-4 TaxID=2953890 RepID=UPI0020B87367|nr:endonuclease NucS domain-containing protein [Chromobacterium sp. IIBBL 290-4]UTH75661.1 endonuclease NucS [Chromobacterium sp. IIBBL 290-4]
MPINHAIWLVGEKPVPLASSRLASEQLLEDMIVKDPRILSSEWMLIGRQEVTSHGGRVDLLAIAPDASLVLIELKRDRTPREIIAQALDYASWVEQLKPDRIAQIFQRFSGGKSLDVAFQERFGVVLDEEILNQSHQIIIVAAELDPSTERIISYLNARDIAVNAVFFQVFEHGNEKLLSRAWLIDPGETQANVASTTSSAKGEKEPWNGEFYVSFGDATSRSWEDARRFGFISGGGGSWYSQTLKLLSPGDRVWVKIPKKGYVGVGVVQEQVQPVLDFKIQTEMGEQPALDLLKHADLYRSTAEDAECAEYFVRVNWLDAVPENRAVNEVGLFGNQNTVCQPTTPKWRHTVDRLKKFFPNWAG